MRDRPYTATAPRMAIANTYFATVRMALPERDNVRDHRARTNDLPFQNHAQVGLRVHRIVMSRFDATV